MSFSKMAHLSRAYFKDKINLVDGTRCVTPVPTAASDIKHLLSWSKPLLSDAQNVFNIEEAMTGKLTDAS